MARATASRRCGGGCVTARAACATHVSRSRLRRGRLPALGRHARPVLRAPPPLATRRLPADSRRSRRRRRAVRDRQQRHARVSRAAGFRRCAGEGFCDTHHRSFGWLRAPGDLASSPLTYVAHPDTAREQTAPRFDLRGVGPVVALELGYALQCRHDQRGAAITPLIFGQVARWLRERPVDSLLIGSDAAWASAAERALHARASRGNPLAWVRYCRGVLATAARRAPRRTRSGTGTRGRRTASTPTAATRTSRRERIYFADIQPGWLRELAKRWARWRITTCTKSPASVAGLDQLAATLLPAGWPTATRCPPRPEQLTRALLEDYRAHVAHAARSRSRDAPGC